MSDPPRRRRHRARAPVRDLRRRRAGRYPSVPVSFDRLEQRARKAMSPEGFAYVAGGAGTEETIRENRAAFERWRIVPRMLRDVSVRDTTRGGPRNAHGRARSSSARSACSRWRTATPTSPSRARLRPRAIPFIFSNQASRPMEETARAMGDAPRWFQLYWSTSNELVASLVSRAERCGCSAIVLTLDTTMLGWRVRDLDLAYLPFLRGKGIAQYTSDPVFVEALQETLRQESPPGGRITLAAIGTLWSSGRVVSRVAAREPPLRARAGGCPSLRRDVLAPVALVGRPRLPRESERGSRSCSRGSSIPQTRRPRSSTGWTGSSSRTTAAARSTVRSRRWTRCPESSTPSHGRVPVLLDSGVRSGADVFRALALGRVRCRARPPVRVGARRRRRGRACAR